MITTHLTQQSLKEIVANNGSAIKVNDQYKGMPEERDSTTVQGRWRVVYKRADMSELEKFLDSLEKKLQANKLWRIVVETSYDSVIVDVYTPDFSADSINQQILDQILECGPVAVAEIEPLERSFSVQSDPYLTSEDQNEVASSDIEEPSSYVFLEEFIDAAAPEERLAATMERAIDYSDKMGSTQFKLQYKLQQDLDQLKRCLTAEMALAMQKHKTRRINYLQQVAEQAENMMIELSSDQDLQVKLDAIHMFEKTAGLNQALWKTLAKFIGAVILAAVTFVVATAVGAAAGLGIGMLAGAWTGPGAMLTAIAGLLKGTITGAALGVVIGAPAVGAAAGLVVSGLSNYGMFKHNAIQKTSSPIVKAAEVLSLYHPASDDNLITADSHLRLLK